MCKREKGERAGGEKETEFCSIIAGPGYMFGITGVCLLWAYDFTLRGKSALLPGLFCIQNVTFNHIPPLRCDPADQRHSDFKLTCQQRRGIAHSCLVHGPHAQNHAGGLEKLVYRLLFGVRKGWGLVAGGGLRGSLAVCVGRGGALNVRVCKQWGSERSLSSAGQNHVW